VKIAKVTGNIVSTIKQERFYGKALKTVVFLDAGFNCGKEEYIALDVAGCTVGDLVLVNTECDAAITMFDDEDIVSEMTICGIIDDITIDDFTINAQILEKNG